MVELYLLVLSILFIASIFADKIGSKFGVPALLLFLVVGMLFGSDGLGVRFHDISLAQAIGTCALCVILFSGGMDTKFETIRPVLGPGITLATIGVVVMGALTGITWWLLGKTPMLAPVALPVCLLIGATMSSTDSASVFSILRSKGINLKYNLKPMLELESGSNDPVAYILTTTMIGIMNSQVEVSVVGIIFTILVQIIVGGLLGFVLGNGLVWFVNKISIDNRSLYQILVFASCIFIFSATYFLQGNPYLAVYIGGLMFGNAKFPHKSSTMAFFDGIGWLCQLIMFLTLGLLVDPSDMIRTSVWLPAIIISFIMIFIARPLTVFACLLPWRKSIPVKGRLFVSWVGLRGASPIIFAILSVAAGVDGGSEIFNIVFFCTLISLLLQGTSIPYMARRMEVDLPPEKRHNISARDNVDMMDEVRSVSTEITITERMVQGSNLLMDLGLPSETLAILIRRPRRLKKGEVLFVPSGKTELRVGDRLLVIGNDRSTLDHLDEYIASQAEQRTMKFSPVVHKIMEYCKQKSMALLTRYRQHDSSNN